MLLFSVCYWPSLGYHGIQSKHDIRIVITYMVCLYCHCRDDLTPTHSSIHDWQVIQLQELPGECPAALCVSVMMLYCL